MARSPKTTETATMPDPVEAPIEVTSEVTEAAPETAGAEISPTTKLEMQVGVDALKKYVTSAAAE